MKKAVVFLCITLSFVFYGCSLFVNNDTYENVDMSPRLISISGEQKTSEIVSQVKSAVVGIECSVSGGYSIGSGVAIRDGGYILTNQHVVNGARSLTVYFADRTNASASIVWQDSSLDLAIVKSSVNMPYLVCSDTMPSVGEDIIAIGTPLTLDFRHTVTKGIVSALNRTIEIQNQNGTIGYMQNLIQHDASINPGNSGGPIINTNGEVVGINTLKASDAEGIGFAIPISVGKALIERVSQNLNWKPSYMGIFGLDNEVAMFKGEKVNKINGVFVYEIDENTINKDYFVRGDIILKINDKKINSVLDLRLALYQFSSGDSVNVQVLRDDKIININCHMLEREKV